MSNNYVTFLALVSTHNIDDYDRAKNKPHRCLQRTVFFQQKGFDTLK